VEYIETKEQGTGKKEQGEESRDRSGEKVAGNSEKREGCGVNVILSEARDLVRGSPNGKQQGPSLRSGRHWIGGFAFISMR
jgi:hypothetical protein